MELIGLTNDNLQSKDFHNPTVQLKMAFAHN